MFFIYLCHMKCVYLRTNNINGKQYVGQTNNFANREYGWSCLKAKYSNPYLDNARKKYGVENFSILILKECDSQEELDRWEKHYIKFFNTIFPNGYNMTEGGTSGYIFTDDVKERMSKALKGKYSKEKSWNYGKHLSDNAKKLLSSKHIGEKNPMFGKTYTLQEKERISQSMINNPKTSKKVYCYKNGILKAIYPSISEAARQTNSNVSHISSCCNGKRDTHNGYTWSYELIA